MILRSNIILVAALLCASTSIAQSANEEHPHKESHIYVRAGVGYGISFGGQTQMNSKGISGSEANVGSNTTMDQKRASFGSGVAAQLAGGYMISPHIGVELAVHAIVAPTTYTFEGPVLQYSGTRLFTSETHAKLPVYIIPAIVFTTGNKLQVYSRTGLVLPIADEIIQTETRTPAPGVPPGQTTEVFTREISNRFSLGIQGALGLSYSLNKNLSVSAEAAGIFRNAYAKRQELTAYTENDLDALPALSTNQIVTEYGFSYQETAPVPATQPTLQPSFAIPFSSLGLQLGVKYHF